MKTPFPARRILVLSCGLLMGLAMSPQTRAGEEPDAFAENADAVSDAGNDRAQDRFSRETPELVSAWTSVLETARQSTALILRDGKPISLATTVDANGWLLTKSSEVHDSKNKPLGDLTAQFPGGITLPVKITDFHRRFDLALIKVEASGLTSVEWDTSAPPAPGSYLAAAGPDKLPVAVGIVSVSPRNLDESRKGFLGISLEKEQGNLRIRSVGPGSAAFDAGLLKDDVLLSIDGEPMKNVSDFIAKIAIQKPYDTLKVLIRRGEEAKEITATLRRREAGQEALIEDVRNTMSGTLSRNRNGYPAALQHDMVLEPAECGGPVVDLHGHIVGINIARSGRIESFAIPSLTLVDLLKKVETGKFNRPEIEDLRREVKNAESLLERIRKDSEHLKSQLKEAEGN